MDHQRWLIIVNPLAGGARLEKAWIKIEAELSQSGLDFETSYTKERGHATQLARTAISQGQRKIIGVGGDGTNNEIINGIFSQTEVNPLEVTYTLLPFGTGNDWSRTHKIPRTITAWLKMLRAGNTIQHSIGKIEISNQAAKKERYFINIAGFAYDAHIVNIAENYPNRSRRKSLYLWLVFKCLFNYSSPELIINFNGEERKGKYYTVNCGLCNYSGGGMKLIPQAQPDGDQLGLSLVRDFPKWLVPFASPKLFSGRIASFRYAEITTTERVTISGLDDQELEVEVDGEYLGKGNVMISIIPRALNVLVP